MLEPLFGEDGFLPRRSYTLLTGFQLSGLYNDSLVHATMRLSCSIANISQKLDPLLLRRSKVNLVNIVRFLAALSWLAVFAVIALVVLRASRGQKLRSANLIVISVAVFAIVVNVAAAGLVFIQPTERGVVVTIAIKFFIQLHAN